MLYIAFENGGAFTDLLADRCKQNASSQEVPWNLILYCDEITPGNVVLMKTAERFGWSIGAC